MDLSKLDNEFQNLAPQLIEWRRRLHMHPELGLNCHNSAAFIIKELEAMDAEVLAGPDRTGVIAVIKGGLPGPSVGFRVDMDALPLEEKTGLPFKSVIPGVMHACGHDGHTALGLGTAALLSKIRGQISGTVKIIFQPGEEGPGGAKPMIEEGALNNPDVAALVGCHIHPSFPAGGVGICSGVVTAGDHDFVITVKGQGGHAARPHETSDPIVAAAHLIVALQTITSRKTDPLDPLVVSICQISGGESHNVIPEETVLKGTIRYLSPIAKEEALKAMDRITKGIRETFDVSIIIEDVHAIPPMIIDEEVSRIVEEAAVAALGEHRVFRVEQSSMGAEDFAFFTQIVPCAYFRLGSRNEEKGHTWPLHNPKFDFDETILVDGVKTAVYMLNRLLTGS